MIAALLVGVVLQAGGAPIPGFAREWNNLKLLATGKNGYEDYVSAAIALDSARHRNFLRWEQYHANRQREARFKVEPSLEESIPPAPAGLTLNSTLLEVRREYQRLFGGFIEHVKAGNLKPVFDPRENYDVNTLFPEFARFKEVIRSMGKVAYVQFADGNSNAGTTTLLEALKFSRNVSRVGPIIGNLVGTAMQSIILAEFEKSLDKVSHRDAQRILVMTNQLLSDPEPLIASLETERKSYAENKAMYTDDLDEFLPEDDPIHQKMKSLDSASRRKVFELAQAKVSRYLQTMADTLKQGDAKWLSFRDDWSSGVSPESKEFASLEELADAFAVETTPVFSQVLQSAAKSKTQLRLLHLHAYVIKFRWEHDRLPDKLEEAVPAKQTIDPFSNSAFVFEPQGYFGYRLYSSGFLKMGVIELRYRKPMAASDDEEGPKPPN